MADSLERTSITAGRIDLDALAFSIAHNRAGEKAPLNEVLSRHGVSVNEFMLVKDAPIFRRRLLDYAKELRENGTSFKLKARIQAEELLKTNWKIIHDDATPAAVAVRAIENTVRWAELEPKKWDDSAGASRPQITVNIDLGGGITEKVVVDAVGLQSPEDGS